MEFSFLQITDHHMLESETLLAHGYSPAYAFRAVMRHIAEHRDHHADFIVTTGDITEIPSETSYNTIGRMLDIKQSSTPPGPALISIEGLERYPMYFLPGNHDDRDNFYRHLFPGSTPRPLMNSSFMHKGVQFICIDWGTDAQAVAHPETLAFLHDALENGAPSIILMHHQVVPIGVSWMDAFLAEDLQRFWDTVAGHRVLGIFSGHLHATYSTEVEGIPVFGLRSTTLQFALQEDLLLCVQPLHYRVVTVRDNVLSTQVVEVPF